MFFGYDASVMSQVNTNPNYLKLMGAASSSSRDSAAVGGIVSVWFGGFAIGALMVGSYADYIGRLKTVQLGCLWALLGAALQASAQNITWMTIARVIGGIGCGHLNTVVPIWTSELADANMRGTFVAVEFTLALSASTLVYWMEYGCTRTTSEAFAWRFPLGFQAIFILILMCAVHFFPESPRHLAKQGKLDEATAILRKCRVDVDTEKIQQEMQGILAALRLEASSSNHSYWSMLTKKDAFHTRRRILLSGGIQVMQKFTGIDFIAAYSPEMFALAGYSSNKSALLAGGNFFGYTASLAAAIYLADHFGRRKMMLAGSSAMGVILIIGGILSHEVTRSKIADPNRTQGYGAGVAAILYIYTFLYGSTWLTTCWVYPTEHSRLQGGTINEIVPYLITAVGFWIFIIFALINFAMLPIIWAFYIETAKRNLEEFDLLFSSKSIFAWRAEREFAQMKARADEKTLEALRALGV
ncbi:MAG: hypothetical protein M1820_009225 [Bogoriella megaspora]|nr:MAG: hypothetical protein M1820_009225 [Bogoriella megaspora]